MESTSSSESSRQIEAQITPSIRRLMYDVDSNRLDLPNFDTQTREDLRGKPFFERVVSYYRFDPVTGENLTDPNEASKRYLLPRAVRHISEAVEINNNALFNPFSGESLTVLSTVPATNSEGKTVEVPDYTSYESRLRELRLEISRRVQEAVSRGLTVRRFDSQTGEPIPQDSLRAFRSAYPNVSKQTASQRERDEDFADAQMGLEILSQLKQMKRDKV